MNMNHAVLSFVASCFLCCLTGCAHTASDRPVPEAATQPGQVREIDVLVQAGRFVIVKDRPDFSLLAVSPGPNTEESPSPAVDADTASADEPADADEDDDDGDDDEPAPSFTTFGREGATTSARASSSLPDFETSSLPVEELPNELTKLGFAAKAPQPENVQAPPGSPLFVVYSENAEEKDHVRQMILLHGYPCISVSIVAPVRERAAVEEEDEDSLPEPLEEEP